MYNPAYWLKLKSQTEWNLQTAGKSGTLQKAQHSEKNVNQINRTRQTLQQLRTSRVPKFDTGGQESIQFVCSLEVSLVGGNISPRKYHSLSIFFAENLSCWDCLNEVHFRTAVSLCVGHNLHRGHKQIPCISGIYMTIHNYQNCSYEVAMK